MSLTVFLHKNPAKSNTTSTGTQQNPFKTAMLGFFAAIRVLLDGEEEERDVFLS